jgi:hypothetical protein
VLAVLLALLLGHRMHASNGNDGILYDLFQRVGGGRAPKAQ